MTDLAELAPSFVAMAHRIVWCTAATVDTTGAPRTRVLHPIWEWDGEVLQGWVITDPTSPKARHLAEHPEMSLTYWAPNHDTCSADCETAWDDTPEGRQASWDRFANGPAPVGYDPSLIPRWTSPDAPAFGVLHLRPYRLRVLVGEEMRSGQGAVRHWRQR